MYSTVYISIYIEVCMDRLYELILYDTHSVPPPLVATATAAVAAANPNRNRLAYSALWSVRRDRQIVPVAVRHFFLYLKSFFFYFHNEHKRKRERTQFLFAVSRHRSAVFLARLFG